MRRIFLLLLFLSLSPVIGSAGDSDLLPQEDPPSKQSQAQNELTDNDTSSINILLAEMNRNSDRTLQLLGRIASDGCSRQLQDDTIKLVANMTHNIQPR